MATITDADRAAAHAEAESIATRWVPATMAARQGLVDDIAAALRVARHLGVELAQREIYSAVCDVRCTAHDGENDGGGCTCLAAAEQAVVRWAP